MRALESTSLTRRIDGTRRRADEYAIAEEAPEAGNGQEQSLDPAHDGKRRRRVRQGLHPPTFALEEAPDLPRPAHRDVLRELLQDDVRGLQPLHVVLAVGGVRDEDA